MTPQKAMEVVDYQWQKVTQTLQEVVQTSSDILRRLHRLDWYAREHEAALRELTVWCPGVDHYTLWELRRFLQTTKGPRPCVGLPCESSCPFREQLQTEGVWR